MQRFRRYIMYLLSQHYRYINTLTVCNISIFVIVRYKKFFMIKALVAGILITLQIACTKNKINDPLPDALQTIIDNSNCTCQPWINKYYWKAQDVYVLGYAGVTCNWVPVYFDASGTTIEMPKDYTFGDFLKQAAFIEKNWDCGRK